MATHTETPADKEEKAKEIWVNTVIQVYMSRKWASVLSFFFFSAFHKQRGKKFPNTSLVNISGIRGLFSSTLGQKGFPSGSVVESACRHRRHKRGEFNPWVGKIPWRGKWQPTPVFLPGKFHGQRTLVGCKDVTELMLTSAEPKEIHTNRWVLVTLLGCWVNLY